MAAFRVAFGVADDLHEFARGFLARAGVLSRASEMRAVDGALVAVLQRTGRYQVELCCLRGDAVIPAHVHPHADTIEVGVAGAVRLMVNGVDPFAAIPEDRLAAFTRGRGIRINATDLHGGDVLASGAMFLSIQRWVGTPRSVLTDYVGRPLGSQHARALQ